MNYFGCSFPLLCLAFYGFNEQSLKMLFAFVIVLIMACVLANTSIYLLGDSVSERIYIDGLVPVLNCTIADPRINRSVESVENYYMRDKGMLCNSHNITRIGYMFHWGVSRGDGDYHVGWTKHRTAGDTTNSHTNVLAAIQEFHNRTALDGPEDKVIFILLSSLWDAHRYYFQKSSQYWFTVYLDEYTYDYTSLVMKILAVLRPNDALVLQTQHKTKPWHPTIPSTALMNIRVKKIAQLFRLPVFDEYELLGENEDVYLTDKHHQNSDFSKLIARNILNHNWTVPHDCECLSVCPT